jgi:nitroimidazol reductase NimA-like FMN-containing flavoprotein (pyridoxamine 5'-phosphate oxidase superfamily)
VASAPLHDSNGLEVLGRETCLELLAGRALGRIGLTSEALPTIVPVNYWFDGHRILVRTSPGTKLHAATVNTVVAFEVDDVDPVEHSGWSVVVTGPTAEITDPEELERLRHAPLPHWSSTDGHVIAIDPAIVSGRRLRPGPRAQP